MSLQPEQSKKTTDTASSDDIFKFLTEFSRPEIRVGMKEISVKKAGIEESPKKEKFYFVVADTNVDSAESIQKTRELVNKVKQNPGVKISVSHKDNFAVRIDKDTVLNAEDLLFQYVNRSFDGKPAKNYLQIIGVDEAISKSDDSNVLSYAKFETASISAAAEETRIDTKKPVAHTDGKLNAEDRAAAKKIYEQQASEDSRDAATKALKGIFKNNTK